MTSGRIRPGVILILVLAGSLAAISSHAAPKSILVKIENMKFDPPVVDARVGDTVVWENHDIFPHTVTASGAKKAFDSGTISASKNFKMRLKRVQSIDYFCKFHPVMKGTLKVSQRPK